MVRTKMFEIKIEKSTAGCRLLNAVNPAKRDTKQARIELAMLDFRTEQCQLTTRARSNLLLGNERLPHLCHGPTPSLCDLGSYNGPGA